MSQTRTESGVGSAAGYAVALCRDLDLIVMLFERIRGVADTRARFEWLYRGNPRGDSIVWLLRDRDGEAIGFTACHPRQVWVDGTLHAALNCGDFSVDPAHRTLGPAVMLRRPAKALVDSGEYAFLYAHPVPGMLAVHRRVGHPQLGEMGRWTFVIDAQELLGRRLMRKLVPPVSIPVNLALDARRALLGLAGRRRAVAVTETDGFGPDYDDLDAELGRSFRVIGRRDRAHLTWRFTRNPTLDATLLEARGPDRRLLGYLVVEFTAPASTLHDMACIPGRGAERALLAHAVNRAAGAGARTISLTAQRGFPAATELRSAGFWEREDGHPTVCYAGSEFQGKDSVGRAENWYMTVGDRDI
jgi:GNAT superfamily N-acetyltransferase